MSNFGRTGKFSEVRGTSLMCNFGVCSRILDVIYAVRPPNGSPVLNKMVLILFGFWPEIGQFDASVQAYIHNLNQ